MIGGSNPSRETKMGPHVPRPASQAPNLTVAGSIPAGLVFFLCILLDYIMWETIWTFITAHPEAIIVMVVCIVCAGLLGKYQ